MKIHFFLVLLYTLIGVVFSSSSYSKNTYFNYNAKNLSSYFSALISFNDFDYLKSKEFFKKIKGSEKDSSNYTTKYIQSLVNLQKFNEAKKYSRNLEAKKIFIFESKLILGLSEFKRGNTSKAKIYFKQIEQSFEHRAVFNVLKTSLIIWSAIDKSDKEKGLSNIENLSDRYNNFKVIQNALAHCFYDTENTEKIFKELYGNKENNFSRYYFFHANYLLNKGKKTESNKLINYASTKYPKNLLINQFKKVLDKDKKNNNKFYCKNKNHILAEIFYIVANALATQGNYELSNFYINLSLYLNPNFTSYESLIAENFFILGKYDKSMKIYKKLSNTGRVYQWHSNRQIAFILDAQDKKKEAINFLKKTYKTIDPDVYQIYDFANFLRNREEFETAIDLYSKILLKINTEHNLYYQVLDRRGTAYERINKLNLAEKDLLMSLKISPKQPYVMNYLAYTWIEQGKNLNKALGMLEEANELKKDDGYITDSLGWALYKLNRYSEAKEYLRAAIILMPSDPIVNDHFADCLWKNNQKIQARYYWNYVLKLKNTDSDLKKIIENKLIFGLEKS